MLLLLTVLLLAGTASAATGAQPRKTGARPTDAAATVAPESPGRTPAGRWRWPLPGRPEVTRRFDPPDTPYGPGHRGVDLAAAPGTPVLSAGPGTVGWAGVLAGRGVVSVRHAGGLRTTYEPVTAAVRAGQTVAAGTRIGLLAAGHPGCPRPACLHWGLLRGTTYLDPLLLLRPGPVRLLPLAPGSAPGAAAGVPAGGAGAPPTSADLRSAPSATLPPTTETMMAAAALLSVLLTRRRPP